MKKILSIVLGVFLCIQAFAQLHVNAGYLNTSFRYGEKSYSYNVNGNGFYAGVSGDFKSTNYPQFSIAPGLNFNLVDYNFEKGLDVLEYSLSAPIHLRYTQPVSFGDVFVSAGPTFVYVLGGKSKASYGGMSYTENEDGGDFDMTIGLEGGVVLSRNIKVMCGYDFGLLNQSSEKDYRITRNFFHVGLGYIF